MGGLQAEFLTQRIFKEVKKMLAEGPKPEELTTAVEADRRSFESSQRTNGYVLSADFSLSHSRLLLDLWDWPSVGIVRVVHLTGRRQCGCVCLGGG